MYHAGNFLAKALLQQAAARVGTMFGYKGVYLVVLERGENLDVALCLLVAHIKPELVELVGSGVTTVEPYVALLSFAKLLAVGLGDERTG